MHLTIRHYNEEDRETVTGMFDELLKHLAEIDTIGHMHWQHGEGAEVMADILKDVESENGVIYIAEQDDEIIGVISGRISQHDDKKTGQTYDPEGRVTQLFVKMPYRGKGIGRSLLDRIEQYFKDEGCESMWIMVFKPNECAYEFYQRHGFVDRDIDMIKTLK